MVKKMEKIKIEKQGRILIPKKIRDKLGIRSGEELLLEEIPKGIQLTIRKSSLECFAELKGCVKKSIIDPMTLKQIWRA